MATTSGYDPKKAELFNQLRQGGLSEDAAAKQAGITDAESGNYAVGDNGQLGATIAGAGKVAGVDFVAPTAAETAESNRFNQGLQSPSNFEQVDYALDAKSPPSSKTPTNYSTTSTETVSGGGSTTVTAGARQPTPASQALQPSIDAKQAEIDQFNRDNPSNFARKKLGLPPLTPEENQARSEKALALSQQKSTLTNQQIDAQAPGTPTVTTVPNTTTTTTTVTTGTTSVDAAVQSPGGADPVLNQQTEENLGVTIGASNVLADPTGVLAAEDDALAADAAAEDDAAAFTTTGPADPTGVLAAEDEAIAAQQAAEDDADAFRINRAVEDPTGVLAAEDAAIAEQEAAQGDADAFGGLATVRDPTGVLAAEDAALAEEAAAQSDVEAFDQMQTQQQLAAQKQATLDQARAQNTIAAQRKNANNADWRVKLRLAPQANYLYAAPNPGILAPLKAQGGVIFPYTPSISTGYKANYSSYDLTHSNYKGYYYQNSAVDAVTLSCPFTAQSTVEANYLLAVIHFFKSVTKMFYGQDAERGTPPPLVYLTGLGEYQFNEHPCVVQSFTYELPTDVDYIRARSPNVNNSNMLQQRQSNNGSTVGTTWGGGILGPLLGGAIDRLANAGLPKGGINTQPAPKTLGLESPTYVPTKMTISITLLPVQSRKQQSQQFSLKQYANGDLLKGGFW